MPNRIILLAFSLFFTMVSHADTTTKNVNIVNTPKVTVKGTPGVTIKNKLTSPVPVIQVQDNAEPILIYLGGKFEDGAGGLSLSPGQTQMEYFIPPGTNLTLKYLSCSAANVGEAYVKFSGSQRPVNFDGTVSATFLHVLMRKSIGPNNMYSSQPLNFTLKDTDLFKGRIVIESWRTNKNLTHGFVYCNIMAELVKR